MPTARGASLIPAGDGVVALDALEIEDQQKEDRVASDAVEQPGEVAHREEAIAE